MIFSQLLSFFVIFWLISQNKIKDENDSMFWHNLIFCASICSRYCPYIVSFDPKSEEVLFLSFQVKIKQTVSWGTKQSFSQQKSAASTVLDFGYLKWSGEIWQVCHWWCMEWSFQILGQLNDLTEWWIR